MRLISKRNILEEISVLTYSRTLQRRFVSGRHTSLVLLLLSVAVWCIGLFMNSRPEYICWPGYSFSLPGEIISVAVPLLCYVAVGFVLVSFHLHESRIHWLVPLYLFVVAVSMTIHYDVVASVSTLLFMLLMRELLASQQGEDVAGSLFTSFALSGLLSFLLPQFLSLLPMLLVYVFIANMTGIKNFMAAILGLLLPFWLFFGAMYVWPGIAVVIPSWGSFVASMDLAGAVDITPSRLILLITELMVMLPAFVVFARSSVPSKPQVRRKFLFVMVVNIWLLLLSCVSASNFELLYAWRVPGIAVMASYLFSFRATRFSNVYFILVFLLWGLIAVFSV